MKLGIYLNSQHPVCDDPARRFAEIIEQVRLVRSLGFDSIWAGEHHITPGFHFFPQLPMLHRLAAEAEGLWLGTNVTLLPLHNPIELAETGAFLDVISGGKFLLGVGLGYRPEEFQVFGVPMSERVSRFTEAVEIIRRLWSEERVTHSGRHWQFSDATIAPRPLQAPRPPIIIGAQVDAALARAARIGDGWLSVPTTTLAELDAQMAAFKSARSAAKLPPVEHLCRMLEVGCAADAETAIGNSAPFLMEKYRSYFSWGLEGLTLDPDADPEQQFRALASKRFAVGTPEDVVEMLVAQHRCGINHLTMRVSWPGMGQGETLASIELLGRKVLSAVRQRIAAAGR
jgi:alkanesulfonate monooxygenase SsuD/methylene tetrahydromethanopterin reductase-like flavin-dependent oxidoreductase (luciferase family)